VAAPVATTGTTSTAAATARATQPAGGTAAATGPVVTVAYDAYAPYYPVRIARQQGLAQQYGITLQPVPFGLGGENEFNEEQRRQALKDGRFDVLLTTLDAVPLFPDEATGKVVAIVDESAGADKIVARQPIARLNDLRGKRITYSAGSVSEYFLYANLSLVGLGPKDVTLVPAENIEEAVARFKGNGADALVGWEPNIGEVLQDPSVKTVIGSDNFRAILDVIVVSDKALREKPDAIQGFVNAWFAGVKLTTDDPQRAGQAVVQSGDTDWTGISKPEDLTDQLALVAQATLAQNQLALTDANTLAGRIREIQATWRAAGKQVANLDPLKLVETRFVQTAATKPELASTKPPVNSSFVLTSRIQLPKLSPEQTGQAQAVAELPLKFIQFEPDSAVITEQSRKDIVEQIVPVLRKTPGLYLKVEGMAAKPIGVSDADVEATARDRTNAVIFFLAGQGIDSNRLIGGTLKPEHPNSPNEEDLRQDRKVVFTLVTPGGR
jgi:NitT/TauT family transport system substrate-binding protein